MTTQRLSTPSLSNLKKYPTSAGPNYLGDYRIARLVAEVSTTRRFVRRLWHGLRFVSKER
jgi:hypothetical protein